MLLLLSGALLLMAGGIGLIRLPDFYSRSHAASNTDTIGVVVTLLGLIVLNGLALESAKLGLVALFACLANPVAVHALAKAAFRLGIPGRFGDEQE